MSGSAAWASLEAGETTEPAVRARWLEDRLVGLELAPVIAELAAIAGVAVDQSEASPQRARSWLGSDTTAVLEQGLGRLPARKLEDLFRRPGLLAGLQELVLTEGGNHWSAMVRTNAATGSLAGAHRRGLARRLGISARLERDDASPPADSRTVESGQWLPLVTPPDHRLTAGRPARRSLLLFVPLAAAAAVLAVIVTGTREPERPVEPAGGLERVVIVRADLPAAGPAAGTAPADERGWPDHPWESLATAMPSGEPPVSQTAGKANPVLPSRKWVVGSRNWTHRLQETTDLSSAQVRAAAAHAREAVTAIGKLAASGGSGLAEDAESRLEATCRKAVAELDQLQAAMGTVPSDEGSVARAKQSIARTLGEIERLLGGDSAAAGVTTGNTADTADPARP